MSVKNCAEQHSLVVNHTEGLLEVLCSYFSLPSLFEVFSFQFKQACLLWQGHVAVVKSSVFTV